MNICIICGSKAYGRAWNTKYCRKCRREIILERKRRDTKIYYKKNRERILARNRWYEKAFKEKRQATYKRYRNTDKYREYSRKRYYAQDINKRKAQYYMSNAIRDKRLIKAKYCDLCGGNEIRIEGHHYKGYAPENWLKVQWLCVFCHKDAHEVLLGK